MSNTKYNLYFVNICFANGNGKVMEIVAIDEDAAKADIMETYGNTGISEIQIGVLFSHYYHPSAPADTKPNPNRKTTS